MMDKFQFFELIPQTGVTWMNVFGILANNALRAVTLFGVGTGLINIINRLMNGPRYIVADYHPVRETPMAPPMPGVDQTTGYVS